MNDHYRKSKRAASFVPLTVTIIVIGIAVWFIYHNSSNCQQPPDKKISTLPGNKKTGVLLSEKIDVSTNEEWQAFSDIEQYHKSNPNKWSNIIAKYNKLIKQYPEHEIASQAQQAIKDVKEARRQTRLVAEKDFSEVQTKAEELISEGKYEQAIAIYYPIIEEYDGTGAAADARRAIRKLEQTISKRTEAFDIVLRKIDTHLEKGEYDQALTSAQNALKKKGFDHYKRELLAEEQKINAIVFFWQQIQNTCPKLIGQTIETLPGRITRVSGTTLKIEKDNAEISVDLKNCQWEILKKVAMLALPDKEHDKFLLGLGLHLLNDGKPTLALKPLSQALASYLSTSGSEGSSFKWDIEEYYKHIYSLQQISHNKEQELVYVGPDWHTQGDWMGRYGQSYWLLFAMSPPFSYRGGNLFPKINYEAYIGTNCTPDDAVRFWCWQGDAPNEIRVLQNPVNGGRRPAGCDDHAEAYPWHHDGPDLYVDIEIPEGDHILSFYFLNYDGYHPACRLRDWTFLIKKKAESIDAFNKAPSLAETRVKNFNDGVYHCFAVSGPIKLTAKIQKDFGFNEMLSGIFLDPIDTPYFKRQSKSDKASTQTDRRKFEECLVDTWLYECLLHKKEQAKSSDFQDLYNKRCKMLMSLLCECKDKNPLGYAASAQLTKLYLARTLSSMAEQLPCDKSLIEIQLLLMECFNVAGFFEDRDNLLKQYIKTWGKYVRQALELRPEDLQERLDAFELACSDNMKNLSWMNSDYLTQLYTGYFETVVKCLPNDKARKELMSYCYRYSLGKPYLTEKAFGILLEQSAEKDIAKVFSAQERYYYAYCFWQQQKHTESIAVFETLLAEGKEFKFREEVLERLVFSCETSNNPDKLRLYQGLLDKEYHN